MNEHWAKAGSDELEPLVAEVARLGGLAEAQIADCVDAIARRDVPLAQAVIARDAKLDALQADIERKAIQLIAPRQPVGQDLRRTVAAHEDRHATWSAAATWPRTSPSARWCSAESRAPAPP